VYIQVVNKNLQEFIHILFKNFNMVLETMLVVFFMPKSITFQSKRLDLAINAIFFTAFGDIFTCQNPNYKSKVEKHWDLHNCVRTSTIKGIKNASLLVC